MLLLLYDGCAYPLLPRKLFDGDVESERAASYPANSRCRWLDCAVNLCRLLADEVDGLDRTGVCWRDTVKT